MLASFRSGSGLIIVRAEITGLRREATLRLAVDTGATYTVINRELLVAIGYPVHELENDVLITTGSDVQRTPLLHVQQIEALDVAKQEVAVLAYTLPPSAGVDSLLGLNFFRDCVLTLDFCANTLALVHHP